MTVKRLTIYCLNSNFKRVAFNFAQRNSCHRWLPIQRNFIVEMGPVRPPRNDTFHDGVYPVGHLHTLS